MTTTVRAYPDKNDKFFNAFVAYVSWYIDKQGLKLNVKMVSHTQTRPAKRWKINSDCGNFKEKFS